MGAAKRARLAQFVHFAEENCLPWKGKILDLGQTPSFGNLSDKFSCVTPQSNQYHTGKKVLTEKAEANGMAMYSELGNSPLKELFERMEASEKSEADGAEATSLTDTEKGFLIGNSVNPLQIGPLVIFASGAFSRLNV